MGELKKLICRVVGCKMAFAGGAHAGCDDDGCCSCSIPVYACIRCGASDYGNNQEASEIMHACALKHTDWP